MKRQSIQPDLQALADMPPWDWPSDSGKRFLGILTDRNARETHRILAARLAGDFTVINDALSVALLGLVSNSGEPEELRAAAAISLGPVLDHADTFEFDDPDDVKITEETFRCIQLTLQRLYLDDSVPELVRRRILEASVRAPQDWHRNAISLAYSSGVRNWMLTAVFSMRWIDGFEEQILAALKSKDPDIHYEAVNAAGVHEVDEAWPHVVALVHDPSTPKRLLLAAMVAVADIRPAEAAEVLSPLTESADDEIAEMAVEAINELIAGDFDDEDEEDEDMWLN